MSSSVAFSRISLLALSIVSIVFFAASSTHDTSMDPYNQLVSLNFSAANFTFGTFTKLCQTILSFVGRLSTMMYSSGSGRPTILHTSASDIHPASSSLSRVLCKSSGRKNIVPFAAFKALYMGTFPVYVPSLTTVWKHFARCINCVSNVFRLANSSGTGIVNKLLSTQRDGILLMFKTGRQ